MPLERNVVDIFKILSTAAMCFFLVWGGFDIGFKMGRATKENLHLHMTSDSLIDILPPEAPFWLPPNTPGSPQESEKDLEDLFDTNLVMSRTEFTCLAKSIYFEAGNQSYYGKMAVGYVVMNRVFDAKFPNTICEVVHQPKQFSWYSDGKSDTPKEEDTWRVSIKAAKEVLFQKSSESSVFEDSGIQWYHADYANPAMVTWTSNLKRVVKIGPHIFYSDS